MILDKYLDLVRDPKKTPGGPQWDGRIYFSIPSWAMPARMLFWIEDEAWRAAKMHDNASGNSGIKTTYIPDALAEMRQEILDDGWHHFDGRFFPSKEHNDLCLRYWIREASTLPGWFAIPFSWIAWAAVSLFHEESAEQRARREGVYHGD